MNGLRLSDAFLTADRQVQIVEDFLAGVTGAWAAVATSGTVAALAERGGGVSITTQAADNAIGSLTLSAKIAVLAAQKPISFAALLTFTEAATNAANVWVGLTSEAVSTAMGADGAGPPANYSGVGFFKIDGGLNWNTEYSVGTTQNTQELTAIAAINKVVQVAGSASPQLLEIDIVPKTSTTCDVSFKINGVCVMRYLDQVYTSIAAMAPVVIVKAGSSTAEVIKVDLIKFAQVR